MIEIDLEPRTCECCGSDDLNNVWSNQSIVKKSSGTYLFRVHVIVCRKCGFCFCSPCAKRDDLRRYYADDLPGCKDISLPYSIERRLSVLKQYGAPSGVFAEIGGDQPKEFHRCLSGLFKTILNVEVSKDAPAEYNSVDELPADSVDVLACYDVLEHVPNVKDFLLACHRSLRKNGVMVCEVPDIRLYPYILPFLEFDHVNHFSPTTLAAIGRACGFKLMKIGHPSSRSFGFTAVFRKDSFQADLSLDLTFEYLDSLSCVQAGVRQMQRVFEHIKSLQNQIIELGKCGKKITLWGVTDLLSRLLENFSLPESAIVVDSDPRRSTHLEREGVPVYQPKSCLAHIQNSDSMVIFAPRYKAEILEWIKRETGREFNTNELDIVGNGLW